MNQDPNIEPVKLIDFNPETLSKVSELVQKRIANIKHMPKVLQYTHSVELENLLEFNVQVLNAFSRVKSESKIAQS